MNCCMHAGGSDFASTGSFQDVGAGGAKRRLPVGGAANGMPKYWFTCTVSWAPDTTDVCDPMTTPGLIVTVGSTACTFCVNWAPKT
jgi:hypothetical protein